MSKEALALSSEIDDVRTLSYEEKNELIRSMVNVLLAAHPIVEAAIEGRPLTANRLENYYGAWTELIQELDSEGCLINDDLFDDLEEMLDSANAGKPVTETTAEESANTNA